MKDRILEASNSAHELEALYRGGCAEFTRAFPDALKSAPDSVILQAWQERLFFEERAADGEPVSPFSARDIWLTAALSLLAGTLAKLPQWDPTVNAERFYARNLAGIVAFALIAWFCAQRLSRWGVFSLVLLAVALLDLNFLTDNPKSESIYIALVHAPFFFWSLVGFAFLGGAWKNLPGRMNYLRYNGELLVYTTVVLLGGMVLKQKSLFTDREFLIAFNVLLLVVLGLCVFSISERGSKDSAGAIDWMNIGLVAVTLAIDAVALAAILFRVSTYGFSPNRIAVLGANLLVFVHLAGILFHYLQFVRQKQGVENLEKWIAGYLPAYTAWSLAVVIGFPLAFQFR